ncbi:MAG: phage baseplate assembly protein V, partial [Desulfobacteraceae bacterium]
QVLLNNADLRLTDSPLFSVGKDVEIHMGYAGNLKPMMLGEIVAVASSFPESGAPTMSITGYDKSHRLRHNLKTRSFHYTTANLIAAQIAAENLLIPIVDPVAEPFETITQNGSDMSFLRHLARRTFFETYVHWDKLYFRFPRPQTEAVFLEWGKNLSSFSPRLSTSGQVGLMSIRDYDQKLAQTIVGLVPVIATDFNLDNIVERLGDGILDQLTQFGSKCMSDETIGSFPDALTFAKAVMEELLEGMFEGNGATIGIPELRAGEMIDVSGIGKQFSGKYRLRKVTHTIDGGGYRTHFEVTQRSSSNMMQLLRRVTDDKTSPNKKKKVNSPVVGTILNNVDPEGLGRVQIRYPWLCGTVISAWARVVQPDIGTYFMPDIGDDVMVSFERGDFDRPIITGAFWNATQTPPEAPTPTNYKKIIQGRTGHKFSIDDTPGNGGIVLETTGGAKINIDVNGNVGIEASNGISIQAKGNMALGSQGNIDIAAKGNVTIKSDGNIELNPP